MAWLLLIPIPIALVILFRVELWIEKRKKERARAPVRWLAPRQVEADGPKLKLGSKQNRSVDNRKAAKRWTGVDL